MEDGKKELKIRVVCEELPGAALLGSPASGVEADRQDIYLGIQHGDEMIEAAPATRKRITFEPSFRVLRLPDDKANFLGPYAKGTPAQRFFYLTWAVKDGGDGFTVIGRTKVHLSHLRWSEIEEALETGKSLTVTLKLTDQRGRPRYASIRGEEATWIW
jgi:hypothetical protein